MRLYFFYNLLFFALCYSESNLKLHDQLRTNALFASQTTRVIRFAKIIGAKLANEDIQLDIEEVNMLKKISEEIDQNSLRVSSRNKYGFGSAITSYQTLQYNLDGIRRLLKYVLVQQSSNALKEYAEKCESISTSPWNILYKIESLIKCDRMVGESIDLYLNFKNLSYTMFKMDDIALFDDNFGFGIQYSSLLRSSNASHILSNIHNKIKEKGSTFERIADARNFLSKEILSERVQHHFGHCLIDNFLSINHWKTHVSLSRAIRIQKDIQLALITGSFCVGIAYKDVEMQKWKETELARLYILTTNYTFERTSKLLNSTWPVLYLREMANVMKDLSYSDVTTEILEEKANQIWKSVNLIGPEDYSKQVVVSAFGAEKESYTLNCKSEFCVSYNSTNNREGKPGLSAVLVRTPHPNYYIRETARFFETNRARIENMLYEYSSILSNYDVIGSIEHELGRIITPNRGHAFLLIRDWGFFAKNCINYYVGMKYDQLPISSNETLNQWRNGITTISNYTRSFLGVCASLYIFA